MGQVTQRQKKAEKSTRFSGSVPGSRDFRVRPQSLELWQQSLDTEEGIGNLGGKAATLHEMAGVISQQGDVRRALELWQQSVALLEHIGDVLNSSTRERQWLRL